uniref:Protein AHNAK2 n=1 Tax=Phasianus colchicus TaxID=9054 RepID=A0A669PBD3_PHACC
MKPGRAKTPPAELCVGDTEYTVKIPKFRKPKFGFSWSKGKPPEIDVKGQKVQSSLPILETDVCDLKQEKCGDASVQKSDKGSSEERAEMGVKMPKVRVSTPEFPKSEVEGPKIEMDISMPAGEIILTACEQDDLNQKSSADDIPSSDTKMTTEALLEVKSPETSVKRISTPKVDISPQSESKAVTEGYTESLTEKEIKTEEEMKGEEAQTEEHQGWFKMPKFRIPAFGRTSLKEKKSDTDVERSLEKPQAGIPSAKVQTEAEITIEKEETPKLGDSVESSVISLPKVEGDISFSAESIDSRVNIPKTETYADIVKRGAEGQKMHSSEFTVSSVELSKAEISASVIDKDNSSPSKFPMGTLTLQEQKVKSQDIDTPKVEMEMQLQKSEGSIGPTSPTTDHKESSARVTVETVDKSQDGPEVNIKIPKLKIPRFTFRVLPSEADVSLSKVVTDPKGTSADIEVVAKSKILTLIEPDIKTAQMTATIDSCLSNAGQDVHWSYIEGQEVREKVEPEHVSIERCEIYSTQILKESEILSSEVKTATLGFSLLKAKLPESHSNLEVQVQQSPSMENASVNKSEHSDESFAVSAQRTVIAELKLSDKPHSETEEPSAMIGLPTLKTKPSSKPEESHPDKAPEKITAAPPSKDEDIVEAQEDEEKYVTNEKEKADSKRSPGRFKFWLPSIGFSSSGDETSSDSKTEVKKSEETRPEDMKPADTSVSDSSKQTEKTGWFRFPKLGFTSPSKKAKTVDKEETGHKERRISDEDSPSDKPDVFFDAQESLSPKEITESEEQEIDGTSSNIPVSQTIVTSLARTELILLEEEKAILIRSEKIPEP